MHLPQLLQLRHDSVLINLADVPAALHLQVKHQSDTIDRVFFPNEAWTEAGHYLSRFDFSLRKLAVDPCDTEMRGQKIYGNVVVHFSQHLRAL